MIHRALMLFAAVLGLAACTQMAPRPPAGADKPVLTILVSIDGFRPDYLDRGATPTLSKLAASGALAAMRPSFPSVTFPNHYTLVTGLRPDRNGIVYNRFEDPRLPTPFSMDARVAFDPRWWEQATPFWITAERQGLETATMFWPGSDFELQGQRPTRWRLFDQGLPGFARVDQLLTWLADPAVAPRFATLYFDLVDTAGHAYGPDAPETTSAAAEVDAALARLIEGLDKQGRSGRVNFVIVADHGMATVTSDRTLLLGLAPEAARVIWDGASAGIAPLPGRTAEVEAALLGRKQHGECWRKADVPQRFAYGSNPRVPDIICLADVGWSYRAAPPPPDRPARPIGGAHGYDPAAPEMAAIFIASGPAFRAGVKLAPFDNVSVYPLLAELTGVKPEPNDGKIADVAAALVTPR